MILEPGANLQLDDLSAIGANDQVPSPITIRPTIMVIAKAVDIEFPKERLLDAPHIRQRGHDEPTSCDVVEAREGVVLAPELEDEGLKPLESSRHAPIGDAHLGGNALRRRFDLVQSVLVAVTKSGVQFTVFGSDFASLPKTPAKPIDFRSCGCAHTPTLARDRRISPDRDAAACPAWRPSPPRPASSPRR